eukprot:Gb_36154 [translate_table: standard]
MAGSDADSSYDGSQDSHDQDINEESSNDPNKRVMVHTRSTLMPWSAVEEGASVEVLKENGFLRFWVRGRIERLEDRKALVQFTGTSADEMQEEWVALDMETDGKNETRTSEEISAGQNHFLQKIRPCINAGNLPKEISMATCTEGTGQVPVNGQLVEAWIRCRYIRLKFCSSLSMLLDIRLEHWKSFILPTGQAIPRRPVLKRARFVFTFSFIVGSYITEVIGSLTAGPVYDLDIFVVIDLF